MVSCTLDEQRSNSIGPDQSGLVYSYKHHLFGKFIDMPLLHLKKHSLSVICWLRIRIRFQSWLRYNCKHTMHNYKFGPDANTDVDATNLYAEHLLRVSNWNYLDTWAAVSPIRENKRASVIAVGLRNFRNFIIRFIIIDCATANRIASKIGLFVEISSTIWSIRNIEGTLRRMF